MSTRCQARQVAACCLILILMLSAGAVGAATRLVSPGESVGDVLAASASGDTVLLGCGVHAEVGLVLPDGVTLRGENGDPACAILESDGSESLVICVGVSATTRLEGITLRLAAGAGEPVVARGGGLLCDNGAPMVSDCRFEGLGAVYGGAAYLRGSSSAVFQRCEFRDNRAAAAGGAVACVGAVSPVFFQCLFVGNLAVEATGGAVNAALGSAVLLHSCTLVENAAAWGGGLASWDGTGVVVQSSIIGYGGPAWSGDAGSVPDFTCSNLHGNSSDWSGALADQEGGGGNISANPYFCGTPGGDLPYGLAPTSPCAPAASGCGRIGAFGVACDGLSGMVGGGGQAVPDATRLRAPRPNPFNPVTHLSYELRQAGRANIAVYDLAGRLVRTLVDEVRPAGVHEVSWRGDDGRGRSVAAGVYFIRLRTADALEIQRATLVK